jgi:hypothetical protein
MPDRSRVMTQTKRETLVLQVGGFGVGLTTPHSKKLIITKVEQTKKRDIVRQAKAHSGLWCQWKKKKKYR